MGGTPDRVSLPFRICCTCQHSTSQRNRSGQTLLITVQLVADDSAHNCSCHYATNHPNPCTCQSCSLWKKQAQAMSRHLWWSTGAALGNRFSLHFPPSALRRASPPIPPCSLNSSTLFSSGCYTLLAGWIGMISFHSHKSVLFIQVISFHNIGI